MSQEKTEEPTLRRLRKARKDGDLPISAALTQNVALIAMLTLLPAVGASLWSQLLELTRAASRGVTAAPENVSVALASTLTPLFLVGALAAFITGCAQTGGSISTAKIGLKLSQLNPVEGLKKLFTTERLTQLARAGVATFAIGWVCAVLLNKYAGDIAATALRPGAALRLGGILMLKLLWATLAVSSVLALIDFGVTWRAWRKRLRMSPEEIKREYKESEGDPQIKESRRRAYDEMLRSAELGSIRNATVVVINPTHIATALRYNDEDDEAPMLLAKGQGHTARQIIDAARAYGVPVVRDVPVARALHALELGDEIPEVLFQAVAEILQTVWRAGGTDE